MITKLLSPCTWNKIRAVFQPRPRSIEAAIKVAESCGEVWQDYGVTDDGRVLKFLRLPPMQMSITRRAYQCGCGALLRPGPEGCCAVEARCPSCQVSFGVLPHYHGE